MSSLVYTNNNNNNNNNLKIEMTGNGAAHLFPIVGINSATKMYRYQNIVPAPTVAATAQTAATTTTSATSGCGKVRKYSARSGDNTTNGISSSSSNNTNASLAANSAPYNIDQSQSVQRRNARERNRVKQVNNSFARLRQHIPQSIIADLTKGGGRGPQKKISKVDTLRIAVEYIRRLQDLVEDLNGSAAANNGGATNNVASFSAAAAALLPSSATSTLSSNNNLAATTTIANNFCNNNNLASTPPPINSTSPLPLMLSNTSSPHHNSINNGNISIAISALQQQQQLTRQQYPNHPLTPISLNAYSPPPAALSTQTQLDQHVGCHSPTSSFNSSMSFDSGTFEAAPQQLSPLAANTPQQQQQQQHQQQQHLPTSVLELPLSQHIAINQTQLNEHHAHLQLKFEPHEHFNLDEEDCTPDDEEILDYISLWQEQ